MSDEPQKERVPSQREIDQQREELRQNLNALEDMVNPAKVVERTKARIKADPSPWIAAATGIAVLVGGIVTLVLFKRR